MSDMNGDPLTWTNEDDDHKRLIKENVTLKLHLSTLIAFSKWTIEQYMRAAKETGEPPVEEMLKGQIAVEWASEALEKIINPPPGAFATGYLTRKRDF